MKVRGKIKEVVVIGGGEQEREVLTGITITFSNGRGTSSSWWSGPSDSIRHAGKQYLEQRGYWNIDSEFQLKYFNKRYEEIVKEYYEYLGIHHKLR